MNAAQVALEVARLAAQLIGALVVARYAVNWALTRYKSEKTWEQRLLAYVSTIVALSEMRLVVGQWIAELEQHRDPPEDVQESQRERYNTAKRRLDEGSATARLLLPAPVSDLLDGIDKTMRRLPRTHDQYADLNNQYSVIDDNLHALIRMGRATLGLA